MPSNGSRSVDPGAGPGAVRRREAFFAALETGDRGRAARTAIGLLLAERAAGLDEGGEGGSAPLLDLETEHDEAGVCITVTAPGHQPATQRAASGIKVTMRVSLLQRALSRAGSRPLVSLLAWLIVEEWRRTVLGARPRVWSAHRIGNAQKSIESDGIRAYRSPARDRFVEESLENGRDIVLVGAPGSGKTTSATMVAARYQERPRGLVWLDLTDPADGVESLLVALLLAPERDAYLVVVDNLQANITAGREIFPMIDWLREKLGLPLRVLVTGWESILRTQFDLPAGALLVRARGDDVIGLLVEGIEDTARVELLKLADGDLVLAIAALGFYRRKGRTPSEAEMVTEAAQAAGVSRLGDPEARRWLYWFACLGMYEINIPADEAEALVPPQALNELIAADLIRPNDESLTVGHRALADLLVRYIAQRPEWRELHLDPPARVAFNYLQRADSRQMLALLDRLDMVAEHGSSESSSQLTGLWRSLGEIGEVIAHHASRGPDILTYDIAAAVDTAIALASLHKTYAWELIAKTVRERWPFADDLDGQWVGPSVLPGEADELVRTITSRFNPPDAERAKRMWMLGLQLDFEGRAAVIDVPRRAWLAAMAAHAADPRGAYYPRPLPAITARIAIGLARSGRRIPNVEAALRSSTEWLRETVLAQTASADASAGGADLPRNTKRGSSRRDSAVAQVAMCTVALIMAGTPLADRSIRQAGDFLWAARGTWGRPGFEFEAAWAIEALVRARIHIEELGDTVRTLADWVLRSEHWEETETGSRISREQRLRHRAVARAAVCLGVVVPELVMSELEATLTAAARSGRRADPTAAARPPEPHYRVRLDVDDEALPARPDSSVTLAFSFRATAHRVGEQVREVPLFVVATTRDTGVEIAPRLAHALLRQGATVEPCQFTVTFPHPEPPTKAALTFQVYRADNGSLVQEAVAVLPVRQPGGGAERAAA